ncbi:transposable element Tcb2 transposase [Trichonephila clavipes]|nr:transposable element Tcb2 transposase [Trichonephila clavipes]
MQLSRHRRQYQQLSEVERERIILIVVTGWSTRRVAHHLGHSDLNVRSYWDYRTRERSVTRLPGLERVWQTNSRGDLYIIRHALIVPTVSLSVIHTQASPSLLTSVSVRTIVRGPLCLLTLTSTDLHLHLEWYCARRDWTAPEWNQIVFSDESRFNLSSDDDRESLWRSRGERLNPVFVLQRHTTSTTGVVVRSAIHTTHGYP